MCTFWILETKDIVVGNLQINSYSSDLYQEFEIESSMPALSNPSLLVEHFLMKDETHSYFPIGWIISMIPFPNLWH